MRVNKWIFLLISFVLLSGCATNSPAENARTETKENNFSIIRTGTSTNQATANQVKEYISEKEEFNEMYAVNTDSQLLIAIQPKHLERFHLKEFRKTLEKDLKDKIRPIKIELSTDKKIAIELKELEEKLNNNSLSRKELEKELDRIIKLSKEQT